MGVDAPDALRLHSGHEYSSKAIWLRDPRRLLSEDEDSLDEVLPWIYCVHSGSVEVLCHLFPRFLSERGCVTWRGWGTTAKHAQGMCGRTATARSNTFPKGGGEQCVCGKAVPDEKARRRRAMMHHQGNTWRVVPRDLLVFHFSQKERPFNTSSFVMRPAKAQQAQAKCSASAVVIREKRLHLFRGYTPPPLDDRTARACAC